MDENEEEMERIPSSDKQNFGRVSTSSQSHSSRYLVKWRVNKCIHTSKNKNALIHRDRGMSSARIRDVAQSLWTRPVACLGVKDGNLGGAGLDITATKDKELVRNDVHSVSAEVPLGYVAVVWKGVPVEGGDEGVWEDKGLAVGGG